MFLQSHKNTRFPLPPLLTSLTSLILYLCVLLTTLPTLETLVWDNVNASKFFVILDGKHQYKFSFVNTYFKAFNPKKIVQKLSIRKLGFSPVTIMRLI